MITGLGMERLKAMVDDHENVSTVPRVFTEAEYRADAKSVVAHAIATGSASVARADGTTRVVISIPPADPSSPDHEARWSDRCLREVHQGVQWIGILAGSPNRRSE